MNFPPRPPRPPRPRAAAQPREPRPVPKWRRPLLWTILVLAVIVIIVVAASRVWTEGLWFSQLHFLRVFTTEYISRILLFVVGMVVMGLVVWASMYFAYRKRPIYASQATHPTAMDRYRDTFDKGRKVAFVAIPLILGLFAGGAVQGQWQTILQFMHRTQFGTTDPQFGMDISFFVFVLPLLRFIVTFLMTTIFLALLAGVIIEYLYGGLRVGIKGPGPRITKAARAHLGVGAALFCLAIACQYWLDRFSLELNTDDKFDGAGNTDIHAVLPAKTILAIIAIFIAVLFCVAAARGNWKLPAIGAGLMILSAIVIGWAYPALYQTIKVTPNAQDQEAPYVQRNIDATRTAFGIQDVQATDYTASTTATAGQLRGDADSTASIRLLDPSVVQPTFRQLQQNKQYYDFPNTLAVDRYKVDGQDRDTVIAVRDLNLSGIPADSQTWVNQHTVYTHGYGVVAAYGNTTDTEGRPTFYEGDIPTSGDLGNYQPRIYFGTSSPSYSIVGAPKGTKPWELDYPDDKAANGQRNNTYTGNGGPSVGNFFNRLIYSVKFGSWNILFSDRVTPDSQILYDRDPATRVQKVAPYLTLDEQTYPAVVDGRVVWIVDGYTTTANYPYSEAQDLNQVTQDSLNSDTVDTGLSPVADTNSVNYMRNSVKAVVDAYTGAVTLYAWDASDPLLKTWSKVYGNNVKPMSDISASLMSHLRYPESLFKVQRSLLATYHVTDARAFYSSQGFWRTPADPTKTASTTAGTITTTANQPPYYLTMRMPDQKAATFSLTSTYIPYSTASGNNERNILTGFLAVDSETGDQAGKVASGYGKLRLLQLPQSSTVAGPGQAQNLFNSTPTVSQALNLLKQGGSDVINGNLLTLPVGGGLLYVEPVYVQASSGTQFPSLQKVLVAFGEKVGFADTLNEALDSVFNGDSGAAAGDAERPTAGSGDVTPTPAPSESPGSGASASPTMTATPSASASPSASSVLPGQATASPAPTQSGGASGTPSATASASTPAEQLSQALQQANQAMQDSNNARISGDWAAYGDAQTRLSQALQAAQQAESQLGG
ncbi:MAG: UPF0182 family protein [Bifidobacteriaceae bacterium]|jgi:uncharacterized membrane protein (UPF0182 family)|nr:UPF0182 family protein [Bifidobacteriaceae bacterium]